jgi:hypothetical protein
LKDSAEPVGEGREGIGFGDDYERNSQEQVAQWTVEK